MGLGSGVSEERDGVRDWLAARDLEEREPGRDPPREPPRVTIREEGRDLEREREEPGASGGFLLKNEYSVITGLSKAAILSGSSSGGG